MSVSALRRTCAVLAAVCAATLLVVPAAHAQPAQRTGEQWTLKPFHLAFEFRLRGMNAGVATMTLKRGDADTWRYESRSHARGIFRLYASGEVLQASTLRITNDGVQPLHFTGDDGTKDTAKDVDLRFDWEQLRATGVAEDKPVDLALQPGVQDAMSVQIALMQELAQGRAPTAFRLADKTQLKDYEYAAQRDETIDTAVGKLKTVVYRSRRPDSRHSTWYWVAPELGYLPVKVERRRDEDVQWSLSVQSVTRD